MDLSLYEQETIIGFCEEEKTAGIYTHNKPLRRKLEQHVVVFAFRHHQAGGLQTRPCIPRWTGG